MYLHKGSLLTGGLRNTPIVERAAIDPTTTRITDELLVLVKGSNVADFPLGTAQAVPVKGSMDAYRGTWPVRRAREQARGRSENADEISEDSQVFAHFF